jgi:hypothetical protein
MRYTKPYPKPGKTVKESTSRPRRVAVEANPLEDTEQLTVVEWLRAKKILFHASPNGGYRHPVTAIRMKRQGCSAGFPDLIILDRPSMVKDGKVFVGAAIEMKRREGSKVSIEQKAWLAALGDLGWKTKIAYGCDEAIKFLNECGYGDRA